MNTLLTRQDLRQLLMNTGVTWPKLVPVAKQDIVIWAALALIHVTLLLVMSDLLVRLWPITT